MLNSIEWWLYQSVFQHETIPFRWLNWRLYWKDWFTEVWADKKVRKWDGGAQENQQREAVITP